MHDISNADQEAERLMRMQGNDAFATQDWEREVKSLPICRSCDWRPPHYCSKDSQQQLGSGPL
jgi:hypothetical protein